MGVHFPDGFRADSDATINAELTVDDLTVRAGGTLTLEGTTILDSTTERIFATDLFFALDCLDFDTIGGTSPVGRAGYQVQYNDDSIGSTDILQDGLTYNFDLRLWTFYANSTPSGGSTVDTGEWYPMRVELSGNPPVSDGLGGVSDSVLVAADQQLSFFDLASRSLQFTPGVTFDSTTQLLTTDAQLVHLTETTTASTDAVEITLTQSEIEFSDTTVGVLDVVRGYDVDGSYTTFDTESDQLRLPPNTIGPNGLPVGTIEICPANVSGTAPGSTPITLGTQVTALDVQCGFATITWTTGSPTTVYSYYVPLDVDSGELLLGKKFTLAVQDSVDPTLRTIISLTTTSSVQIIPANAVPAGDNWGGTYVLYAKLNVSEEQIIKILEDAYAGVPTSINGPASTITLSYALYFNQP